MESQVSAFKTKTHLHFINISFSTYFVNGLSQDFLTFRLKRIPVRRLKIRVISSLKPLGPSNNTEIWFLVWYNQTIDSN